MSLFASPCDSGVRTQCPSTTPQHRHVLMAALDVHGESEESARDSVCGGIVCRARHKREKDIGTVFKRWGRKLRRGTTAAAGEIYFFTSSSAKRPRQIINYHTRGQARKHSRGEPIVGGIPIRPKALRTLHTCQGVHPPDARRWRADAAERGAATAAPTSSRARCSRWCSRWSLALPGVPRHRRLPPTTGWSTGRISRPSASPRPILTSTPTTTRQGGMWVSFPREAREKCTPPSASATIHRPTRSGFLACSSLASSWNTITYLFLCSNKIATIKACGAAPA